MIQVNSQTHKRIGLLRHHKGLEITEKLKDGDKSMTFSYPTNGPLWRALDVENYLVTKDDEFVLKEVKKENGWYKCRAVLNLEDLIGKSWPSFEAVEKTPEECLTEVLEGTGWTVGVCKITKRRTIRKDSPVNALEIINECISTYKMEIRYRSRDKVIDIYETIGIDRGVYFMEAVNLRKPPSVSRSANEFYTQIRPIGKDGLRISVDGKDYLENHSYSPKNLMLTWKDERYTEAASLAEDAALKLAEICQPMEIYEADVIDLAATSKGYSILEYDLGDIIMLASKTSGVKKKMRIVQLTRYPQTKEKNKCQLSNTKKSFADVQKKIVSEAVEAATGTAGKNTEEVTEKRSNQAIEKAVETVEKKGYATEELLEEAAKASVIGDEELRLKIEEIEREMHVLTDENGEKWKLSVSGGEISAEKVV